MTGRDLIRRGIDSSDTSNDLACLVILNSDHIVHILKGRAEAEGGRVAFTFLGDGCTETESLTYRQLDASARSIAAQLLARFEPGERALLLFPSGLEFLRALFGCMYAGVVAVPLYPPRRNRIDPRILQIVSDAEPAVALTTGRILSELKNRLENAKDLKKLAWLATDTWDVGDQQGNLEPRIDEHDVAFLQYTSGSTSAPKGVIVSHANLLHNLADLEQGCGHTPASRMVSWLPIYHDMGLIYGMLQPVFSGFPCYFMPPPVFFMRPIRWLEAISQFRATHSAAPNFAYDLVVQNSSPKQRAPLELSTWEMSANGAEPVRSATLARFFEAFKSCGLRPHTVCPGYGLAEATLKVCSVENSTPIVRIDVDKDTLADDRVVPIDSDHANAQSLVGCGTPPPGRVEIVDPKSLTRCAPNRVGEVWVSGSAVAQGYWNRPEETQQTFHACLSDSNDGPFLRTGDLGFVMDGQLFVTGRLKDLIIVRGQNIYPQDVESTVEACHQALRPNCGAAFGIEVMGEERLVVVHEIKRTSLRHLDVDDVVGAIRKAVFEYHAVGVHAVILLRTASIPKTSSGKIQRHACRRGFCEETLNVVGQWHEP